MIFDGHCDIFTDVLRRRLCGETQVLARHHLPKLRAGGIRGGNPNVPGLEDASRTPVYVEALRRVGFSERELAQISWQNWLRVIGEVVG